MKTMSVVPEADTVRTPPNIYGDPVVGSDLHAHVLVRAEKSEYCPMKPDVLFCEPATFNE